MSTNPIVIERTYDAPLEKVWKAITNSEQLKQWYFPDIEGFQPVVGAEFTFTGENKGVIYHHLCKVLEVEPLKKLKHSWRYEDHPGNSFVTWELFAEANKTKVRLTHEGLETFPDTPDFARQSFEAGWKEIVGKMLKEFLEKQPVNG
jgi:uncharacterized protein YndB with AHSA1/START domain